jgi:hypothetical protein
VLSNPITGITGCCALPAIGHAPPPSSVMTSRRWAPLLRLGAAHYHTIVRESRRASQQKVTTHVRVGFIRVAPTGSKASPNVRYAFNGNQICASQRTDVMCQNQTSLFPRYVGHRIGARRAPPTVESRRTNWAR